MVNNIKLTDNERQPCEIWTRVMGYFRPLSQFNQGKQSEFFERKYFKENKLAELQKQIDDYEQVLNSYAQKDMFVEEFAGYDYDSVVTQKRLNPHNAAKDVLDKYTHCPKHRLK